MLRLLSCMLRAHIGSPSRHPSRSIHASQAPPKEPSLFTSARSADASLPTAPSTSVPPPSSRSPLTSDTATPGPNTVGADGVDAIELVPDNTAHRSIVMTPRSGDVRAVAEFLEIIGDAQPGQR